MTVCVVGAGAAGLAAARHLAAASLPFEVLEREREVGGIWDASLPHSPVYASARLISSKPLTQFPDFPMPREYPDYPGHTQALAYLRAYAKRFGLYDHIRFGQTVAHAEPAEAGWSVTLSGGETRSYAALIVASGIHWAPSLPKMPESFDGECIHSCRYKTPETFRGRRVLVVGGGNSGCDIAVDASEQASRAFLSLRRGYHFIPKYAFGRPIDQVGEVSLKLGLPLAVRRALNELVLRAVVGRPEDYGLPHPDHRLLESHPIVNSRILPAIRRGDLRPTSEPIDLVVFATGYRVTFPFLEADRPDLYLHVFHPTRDDLFILGMIQPDSGVWPLMDLQARAVASHIRKGGGRMRAMKQGQRPDLSGGIRYLSSERHRYEVEHSSYARQLRKVIRLLEA